jgi:hypothetical protein
MADGVAEIRIEHLSKADLLDLEQRTGSELCRREAEPVPEGSQGEPIIFAAVLVITAAALKGYIAHLRYKAAMLPDTVLEQTVTYPTPEGPVTTVIHFETRDGKLLDSTLRELATIPGLESALESLTR